MTILNSIKESINILFRVIFYIFNYIPKLYLLKICGCLLWLTFYVCYIIYNPTELSYNQYIPNIYLTDIHYYLNSFGNIMDQIVNFHSHIISIYILRILLGLIIPIFQLIITQHCLIIFHIITSILISKADFNLFFNLAQCIIIFNYIEIIYIAINQDKYTSTLFFGNYILNIFKYIYNQIRELTGNVQSGIQTINTEYRKSQKLQDEKTEFNYSQNSYDKIQDNHQSKASKIITHTQLDTSALTEIPRKEEPISIEEQAKKLQKACEEFNFSIKIQDVHVGPSVITYEVIPESGTKMKHFISYNNDIARLMSAKSVLITPKIGANTLQIQIPRQEVEFYSIKDILESDIYIKSHYDLPIIIGKKMDGKHKIIDLSTTPHLLLAGTTGSGKSVQINVMIMSLIFRFNYTECQFIMIDPKMLELSIYSKIPHLLMPVITKPKHALLALQWCVKEMNRRYTIMQKHATRNIKNFNTKVESNTIKNESKLPYIVVIVDEFADLILTEKAIENEIQRLAQMARAAGIHLIIGTQRPSTNVITGVIKASLPARICLKVSSSIDSNITLNEKGAENLLGKGDLFLKLSGENKERILGPYITEEEIDSITSKLHDPNAIEHKIDISNISKTLSDNNDDNDDNNELSNEVYQYFLNKYKETGKNNVSISEVQRKFKIGFNKAASIIDKLEDKKIITPPLNDQGKRQLIL